MRVIKNILLAIPLIWFLYLWLNYVFGIQTDFGIIYDDMTEYHGDGLKPSGLIPNSLMLLILFLGTPITLLAGSIYTYIKKYWWWFGAYIVLGGGLFFCAYYARFS